MLYQPNMPKFTTERLDFAAQAEPERRILAVSGRIAVSPGLTSRPSLSVCHQWRIEGDAERVAGVNLPAFVERAARCRPGRPPRSVAGVNLPAFVERRPVRPRWSAR